MSTDFTGRLLVYLRDPAAEEDIRSYYSGSYTGGRWDAIVAALPPHEIGLADAAATAMLSLGTSLRGHDGKVSADALMGLLDRHDELHGHLKDIRDDLDLHDVDAEQFDRQLGPESAAHKAWELLKDMGVGVVARNKMLAGKRPRLIPVFDRKVAIALAGRHDPKNWWRSWWEAMRDEDVRSDLAGLQASAPSDISLLRLADVVVWMAVQGRSQTSL